MSSKPRPNVGSPTVGQSWGYRVAAKDRLVEVSIVRIGVRKPARMLIRFVDDAFEGRQDWVPPSRLKTPWSQAGQFLAWERRWQTVVDASSVARTPAEHATSYIFDVFIDHELATTDINGAAGVSLIHDVVGLAQSLDLDTAQLTTDPIAFVDGRAYVVPWSITELIASTAARNNSTAVQHHVQAIEAAYLRKTVRGEYLASRSAPATYVEADQFVQERNAIQNAPYWELLRTWSGARTEHRPSDLDSYRQGAAWASAVAQEAISLLRAFRHLDEAERLERQISETMRPTAPESAAPGRSTSPAAP